MEFEWENIPAPPCEGRAPTSADMLERFVFSANALKRFNPKTDFSKRLRVPTMKRDDFPDSFLEDFLEDRTEDREKFRKSANLVIAALERNEESAYAEKIVRKNGKDRVIHSPDGKAAFDSTGNNALREVQESVRGLMDLSPLPDYVIGFRKNTSPYSALRKVLDNFDSVRACFSIDVRNFFPSVTEEMVKYEAERLLTLVEARGTRTNVAGVADAVARICTFRWGLVQGASSSPVLANMVALTAIDGKLRPLLADLPYKTAYFRYADDIVVLSDHPLPKHFQEKFLDKTKETGFEIAEEKTEYRENSAYYPVLGIDIVGNETGGVRFRFPKRKAKLWAKEILEACDVTDYPVEPSEFLRDPRISKTIACLGHAAYVNRIGEDRSNTRSKRNRHEIADMNAPAPEVRNTDPIRWELRHAWGIFRTKFSDRLPKRSADWFTVSKK